jgi:hypothetical protein
MNLNEFATKITAENDFVKASFGGFAGSGKTRTATEFIIGCYKLMKCNKPVLIANEKGSRFLVPLFKKAGIECLIKETVTLPDVLAAFEYLNKGEISFLFIDSLTKVWYKYIADYKTKNNNKVFMTLQDWGKILPAWQEEFANKFVALTGNCVFTGRGGYTYDMEENDETHKKEFTKSGVKMKMAGETPFEPDINVWMEIAQEMEDGKPRIWREALIMKDRSGLIDGKTFKNPSFKDFEPFVKFLVKADKGEVAKASNTSNIAPKEEYNDKKVRRDVLNEKIKAEFDKRGFGTSKEEKAAKLNIIQQCFDTTSATEIENKRLEDLELGLQRVTEILQVWDTAENKSEAIKDFKFSFFNQPKS